MEGRGRPKEAARVTKAKAVHEAREARDLVAKCKPSVKLKGEALRAWKRNLPGMVERGLVEPEDLDMLTAYCVEMGNYYDLNKIVDKEGRVIGEGDKRRAHPAVGLGDRALRKAQAIKAMMHRANFTKRAKWGRSDERVASEDVDKGGELLDFLDAKGGQHGEAS